MAIVPVDDLLLELEALSTDQIVLHRGQGVRPVRVPVSGVSRGNTLEVDLDAIAHVTNPDATSTEGLIVTLTPIPSVPAQITESRLLEPMDLASRNGQRFQIGDPITERPGVPNTPDDTGGILIYDDFGAGLQIILVIRRDDEADGFGHLFSDLAPLDSFFESYLTWAQAGPYTNTNVYAGGTGRFSSDEKLREYIEANHGDFQDRLDIGRTHLAYFNTTSNTIRVVELSSVGAPGGLNTDQQTERFRALDDREAETADFGKGDADFGDFIYTDTIIRTEQEYNNYQANTVVPSGQTWVLYVDVVYITDTPGPLLRSGDFLPDSILGVTAAGFDLFADDVTWCHIGTTFGEQINSNNPGGTSGRFASGDEAIDYVNEYFDVFKERAENGRYKVMYYDTTQDRLSIIVLDPLHYPDEGNDWVIKGEQRDGGVADTPAAGPTYTNSRDVQNSDSANQVNNIVISSLQPDAPPLEIWAWYNTLANSLIWQLLDNNGAFGFVTRDSLLWNSTITWANVGPPGIGPGAQYEGSEGRFADEAALVAYLATQSDVFDTRFDDGRTHVAYFDESLGTVRVGEYNKGAEAIPGTPEEDISATAYPYAQEIIVRYTPAAEGLIPDADTVDEVKDAIDAIGMGLHSILYGGAASDDDFARAIGWEASFGGALTLIIQLGGFGLGPPQNLFTGTTEQDAIDARDTYANANPSWFDSYEQNQELFIALRWGTTGESDAYLVDENGNWRKITFAFKGDKGDMGIQGLPGRDGNVSITGNVADAIAAQAAAEAAQQAAETAQSEAESAASAADNSARQSSDNAIIANTRADDAERARDTAEGYEASANARANAALNSEVAADSSANQAQGSRNNAENFSDLARDARAESETARDEAQDAQAAAEAARDAAISQSGHQEYIQQAITDGTQVGATVELTDTGELNINITGGTPPVLDHTTYIAWSNDAIGTEFEALNGNNSTDGILNIPARTANGYIIIYSPENEGYPTSIHLDGNPTNLSPAFTLEANAVTIDVSGSSHYVLVSSSEQNAAILGTGLRTYTVGYN